MKLINSFHKKHSKKRIATSLLLDSDQLIAKLTVKPIAKPIIKQKLDKLANIVNKQAKN